MRALDDSDPRLIGRFLVLGLLGAGGMGRVYLARPADGPDEPDALVAVKVAATVPVGVSPVSLAVAPDSSRVYVVDATADTIILMQRP
jgi:hypothetical protein